MASSIERVIVGAVVVVSTILLAGCSDLPSKDAALELVQRDVKEEATCTLPVTFLSRVRKQYTSKALCVPRDSGPPPNDANATMACLDALVASGATKRMPGGYMAEWPDEVSSAGFDAVSPYDRRARDLIYKGCYEMSPDLREGRFRCGQARADRVLRVTKKTDGTGQATIRYARAITLDAQLPKLEAVCGAISRPAPEEEVVIEKNAEKKWVVAPPNSDPSASPATSSSAK